ncbi:MAG: YbaB/EbfC family nucleoid-associated protein [Microbacterium sp.]|jgi:DNA-binding protein YbaB|uniref:YbaB/EbfC family nucleoid-associated protein n=1 Tax=Microbacterium sp. TaxID=51671 RepID=UPI00282D3AFA|nr:YbaB/EbfC family nucleoid-associated protein [Microbacterium sp.]MDR2320968.1 YbaB/EbfC family nucleoid-associated protein [Microbacterium sp.]
MPDSDFDAEDGIAAAQRQLQEAAQQAQQNRDRAQQLSADVERLTGTARSRRGEVTVRARVGGRIDDITFAESADDLTLQALARLTVQTIANAQHDAMSSLAERGAELFGAESDIAASLRSDADRGFPAGGPQAGGLSWT